MTEPRDGPDPSALLPDDLRALVESRDVPLVEAEEITVLRSASGPRGAYRLRFADETVLKGRLHPSSEAAAKVHAILEWTDPAAFPRIVARRGAAVLEEWVRGDPVGGARCLDAGVLEAAGRLMAALHVAPMPEAEWGPRRRSAAAWRDQLDERLAFLGAAALLEPAAIERLRAAAVGRHPDEAEYGFIHRDICPENLVRDPAGNLWSIDNATLEVGPLEHDLGRTWYRWPMSRDDRGRFLRGYGALRSPERWLAHLPFWTVGALAEAVWLRASRRLSKPEVPLERLRDLARRLERGASIPDDEWLTM